MIQLVQSMNSVVIPLYNEQESIEELYKQLTHVMRKMTSYELLFIDDGSTDASLETLKMLEKIDKHVKIFSFRKNMGKAEALSFGFQKATGDIIVTLDADLQDLPSQIPLLFSKQKTDGWGVVCGWRKNRKDSFTKVISSKLFNGLVSKLWGLSLHDYNCGLKLYTRDAAKSLRLYGGMHRFIPLLVYNEGFSVTEVVVEHEKRKFGKSKYGFSKLWKDLPDIFSILFITRYGNRPLHFFGMVGGILLLLGIGILGYLTIIHFQGEAIGRRPLLFFGMLLILSGFQVFFTGFLADLILNISHNERADSQNTHLRYSSTDKDIAKNS